MSKLKKCADNSYALVPFIENTTKFFIINCSRIYSEIIYFEDLLFRLVPAEKWKSKDLSKNVKYLDCKIIIKHLPPWSNP